MTVKQLIKSKYESLSKSEKKVAKYVIDNYHHSVLMSSGELSAAAGVSDTAVIRFAKALGFKGFLDYKKTIKAEYSSSQKVYEYLKLMDASNEKDNIPRYLSSLREDIEQFIHEINVETLDRICEEIHGARTVYLVGLGSDIVVSRFLQNYIKIMGINCIPINGEGLSLREDLFLIGEEDVVLMSSYPTLLEDEEWIAKYCREKSTPLLALTDSEITADRLGAKYYVRASESTDLFFNSYVLPMIFCNVLLLRLYEKYSQATEQFVKEYQKILL